VEKTHRAPPSRTQRAPTGVTTRIAHTLLSHASLLLALRRIHPLALALLATLADLLSPRLTRLLRLRRLSGIRSLYEHEHDYEPAAASNLRLCRRPGIRFRHDHDYEHDHDSGIRFLYDYEHEHEHEHDSSAGTRPR